MSNTSASLAIPIRRPRLGSRESTARLTAEVVLYLRTETEPRAELEPSTTEAIDATE